MIELTQGNIITADAEALVNSVNCVGVMGKGVALQFRKAFPDNYKRYRRACDERRMVLGEVLVTETGSLVNPKFIMNFPTKGHWRGDSRLEDIRVGLGSLANALRQRGIASVAVPPLGCGNGGLDWEAVRPVVVEGLADLTTKVILFEPGYVPEAGEQVVRTKRPRLTALKALIIKLFHGYALPGHEISAIEAQKLAWLIDRAGASTRLSFVKGEYGPYAGRLNFALQEMDGHFLTGTGDRAQVRAQIIVVPGAVAEAESFLKNHGESVRRLNRVLKLVRGFETPYGMELLATVDWIACREEPPARNEDDAVRKVAEWSERKARLFDPEHVRRTWQHMVREGWIEPAPA